MGCRQREQPKISEEGIRPAPMIVQGMTLTRPVVLSAQHSPQATVDKAVDGREGEPMGVLEVTIPALQERIERRNRALDRMTSATLGAGTDFVP